MKLLDVGTKVLVKGSHDQGDSIFIAFKIIFRSTEYEMHANYTPRRFFIFTPPENDELFKLEFNQDIHDADKAALLDTETFYEACLEAARMKYEIELVKESEEQDA